MVRCNFRGICYLKTLKKLTKKTKQKIIELRSYWHRIFSIPYLSPKRITKIWVWVEIETAKNLKKS